MGVSALDPPRNQAAENMVLEAFQGFSQKRPGYPWRIAQGTSLVLTPPGYPLGYTREGPALGYPTGIPKGLPPGAPGHSP